MCIRDRDNIFHRRMTRRETPSEVKARLLSKSLSLIHIYYIVSWCFGHLVELADASSYDERYAKWRYDDLPIVPENWMFEVTKEDVYKRQ